MKKSPNLILILTIPFLLVAPLAVAQQSTPQSPPSTEMQSPAENRTPLSASPQTNEQDAQQVQNMDKMATSMTQMAEMCKMMMNKQMAGMPYIMTAGIALGVVLFLDLLLLVILQIQWIIYWGQKLKSEKQNERKANS
jgi:hypothetical protein